MLGQQSDVQVVTGLTPQAYVEDFLLGGGVTATNVTFSGDPAQLGFVSGFIPGDFPVQEGVALGSAGVDYLDEATNLYDSDCTEDPTWLPVPAPVDIANDLIAISQSVAGLIGQTFTVNAVNDVAVLEFDFTAVGDSVSFSFVFASGEFPGFVLTQYNDVFAMLLSGPGIDGPYSNNAVNMALVPDVDPALPITVSSIWNSAYYVDNPYQYPICPGGHTTKIKGSYPVQCGAVYHIALAIGDASDTGLSSFVVLEPGSFQSQAVMPNLLSTVGVELDQDPQVLFEDCGTQEVVFARPPGSDMETPEEVTVSYSGTGVAGEDFTGLPEFISFPPGVASIAYPFEVVADGVAEGEEAVVMLVNTASGCDGAGIETEFEFLIQDTADSLVVTGQSLEACANQPLVLTPTIEGGYGNFDFAWSCDWQADSASLAFVPTDAGTFECVLTVSDTCGMAPGEVVFTVEVTEFPELTVSLGEDVLVPCGEDTLLVAVAAGGNPGLEGYIYAWEDQDGVSWYSFSDTSLNVSPQWGVSAVTATVVDQCGAVASDTVSLEPDALPLEVDLQVNGELTACVPYAFDAAISGGEEPLAYIWSIGGQPVGFAPVLEASFTQEATLSVTVSDACGQTVTASADVILSDALPPALEIGLQTQWNAVPDVPFSLPSSVSGGVPPYEYLWSVVGTGVVSIAADLEWDTAEDIEVQLSVSDACGQLEFASTFVQVVDANPMPLALSLPATVTVECGDSLHLFPEVSGGALPYTFSWSGAAFGDQGGASWHGVAGQSGAVTLSVTDGFGSVATGQVEVLVPPLSVDLSAGYSAPCNSAVLLEPELTGAVPPLAFDWTSAGVAIGTDAALMLDGGTEEVPVQLTVTDGCDRSVTSATVLSFPTGAITLPDNATLMDGALSLCSGDLVLFEIEVGEGCGEGDVAAWMWDFGDGTSLTSANLIVPHLFSGAGCFLVTLTPLDDAGNPIGTPDSLYAQVAEQISWDSWDFSVPDAACLGMAIEVEAFSSSFNLVETEFSASGLDPIGPDAGSVVELEIPVFGFTPGATLTDCAELTLFVNMEHSYLGDLDVALSCPDGTTVSVLSYPNAGGGTHLGEAVDLDSGASVPGEGYTYGWNQEYAFTSILDFENWTQMTYVDNAGNSETAQVVNPGLYLPEGEFCAFEGCPVNGVWTLTIIDNLNADDGHIFEWGLSGLGQAGCGNPDFVSSLTWSDGQVESDGNLAQFSLNEAGQQPLTLEAMNQGGCTADTTFVIEVADPSALEISAGLDLTACSAPFELQGEVVLEEGANSGCTNAADHYTYCYLNNDNWSETYCPDVPGDGTMMSVLFSAGQVEGFFDHIYVYDGGDVNAPLLLDLSGDFGAESALATNPDGCLTVQFVTDGSVSCASGNYDPVTWCVGCGDGGACDYAWNWSPAADFSNASSQTPEVVQWTGQEQVYTAEVTVLSLPNCIVTDSVVVSPSVPGYSLEAYGVDSCATDSSGIWMTVMYDGAGAPPPFSLTVNGELVPAQLGAPYQYATLTSGAYGLSLTAGDSCPVAEAVLNLEFAGCLIEGCTDPEACNFDAEAGLDDGSCLFADGPCEYCDGGTVVPPTPGEPCTDLQVDVVMDTVLYDGFESIAPGYRRYRLYAVLPGPDYRVLGPVADDVVNPPIPGFGFSADCGCFNVPSSSIPPGSNVGNEILTEAYGYFPELAYDTWWSSDDPETSSASATVFPSTFPDGFDICQDQAVQGGVINTNSWFGANASWPDGRVLIGQITTCETFSFQVCVAMVAEQGGEIFYACTDGEVEVPDLCAPIHEAEVLVQENGVEVIGDLPASARVRLTLPDWPGVVLDEQYGQGLFDDLPSGGFAVDILDTATTVAWSSNTCRSTVEFNVACDANPTTIPGCTFSLAQNFNPLANAGDGSCILPGCTSPEAINFNPYATISDGSCFIVNEDCPADFNFDGFIGVADLIMFLQNFGAICP